MPFVAFFFSLKNILSPILSAYLAPVTATISVRHNNSSRRVEFRRFFLCLFIIVILMVALLCFSFRLIIFM